MASNVKARVAPFSGAVMSTQRACLPECLGSVNLPSHPGTPCQHEFLKSLWFPRRWLAAFSRFHRISTTLGLQGQFCHHRQDPGPGLPIPVSPSGHEDSMTRSPVLCTTFPQPAPSWKASSDLSQTIELWAFCSSDQSTVMGGILQIRGCFIFPQGLCMCSNDDECHACVIFYKYVLLSGVPA